MHAIEQRVQEHYSSVLYQLVERQEAVGDDMLNSVASALSNSTSNIRFIDVGRTNNNDDSLSAGLACAELNRLTEMVPLVKSAYLMCNLNHTIYNSIDNNGYSEDDFYDLSWRQQYFSSQGGLQLLDTARIVRTPSNPEEKYITMVSRVPFFSTLQNKCLVFNISVEELASTMLQIGDADDSDTDLWLYNSKGALLWAEGGYSAPKTLEELALTVSNGSGSWHRVTIDNADYMVVPQQSASRGWTLLEALPYNKVQAACNYYIGLMSALMGVAVLTALMIIFFSTYERQRKILQAGHQVFLASDEEIGEDEDGLAYLQRIATEKSKALERSDMILSSFSNMLEQNVVLTLIDGDPIRKDELPAYRETMSTMGLLEERPQQYIVLLVRVEAITNLKMNLHQDIYSKFRRILQYSCSQQLLEDFHACYAWADIATMVGIVCYPASFQSKQVKLALDQMGQSIQKQLTLLSERPVTIAFGEPHPDPWSLVQSYEHAKQLIQHKIYYHKEKPYTYQDMVESDIQMNYDSEKQLIDQIKLGRVQETTELLESYFSILHSNPYVDLEQVRSICSGLAGSIGKAIADTDRDLDPRFSDIRLIRQHITELTSVHEVADYLVEYAQAEARAMLEQLRKKKDTRVQDALDWIESNYSSDIALDDVAEQMELSPAYASKQIKAYTGQSVVNYINQVRIEHAKELLASTKMSSNEISTYVGFRYSQSFIRTFRKTVGMTPGNYRSLYQKGGGSPTAAAEADEAEQAEQPATTSAP